jgi:hypothetical protein
MSSKPKRHPLNVPGPFYVESGCCTACMAPHVQAPDMMGFDEAEGHCFVQRQPQSKEEVYKAMRAVWSTETDCLRYAGNDQEILRRLVELGGGGLCDTPVPPGLKPTLWNHVTLEANLTESDKSTVRRCVLLARSFSSFLSSENTEYIQHKVTPLLLERDGVSLAFSWFKDNFHRLTFTTGEAGTSRWLVSHSPTERLGSTAVSLTLDDWLRSDERFHSVRWHTTESWNNGTGEWQETPI